MVHKRNLIALYTPVLVIEELDFLPLLPTNTVPRPAIPPWYAFQKYRHLSTLISDISRLTAYSADIAAIVCWQDAEATLAISDKRPFSLINPETGLLLCIDFGMMETLGTIPICMVYSYRRVIFL